MREFATRVLHPGDVFMLEYVHEARLSPDGRRVAYVTSRTVEKTGEEFFEITIEELATGARRALNFPGCMTLPRWSPDGARLAFIGAQGNSQRLYVTDANADGSVALTSEDRQALGPPAWSPDGSAIAYTVVAHRNCEGMRRITRRVFRAEGRGLVDDVVLSIHVVNVQSGSSHPVKSGKAIAMRPSFSPCGKHLLFMGTDVAAAYLTLGGLNLFTVDLTDGRVVEVLGERWCIIAAAWSPCGERVVVAGDYKSKLTVPKMDLWVVNRDGSNAQCRTEGLTGNVGLRVHHDMPTWDTSQNSNTFSVPDAGQAYASVTTRGCTGIWRIALTGPPRCEPVVSGRRSCVIMDASAKASRLLYCVSDLNSPWDLYRSDLNSGEETRITHLNEAILAGWPALRVEHLTFESADGLPLEGWYLARADHQSPQPAVMFIHGGPFLATGHAFRFDFHLLAANGYAVLFANFRGSAGYGEAFAQGIMGDWGARGFPDHMALADAAIARGLVDADRLGVWGPSHGGFATAWIVGHTTRFRAAVVESASTNWVTMYYLSDVTTWIVKELGGRPDEIPDVYRSRSPLSYAWRCRTPTLLLHGEEDVRCPMAEAEQFYRALHDAGCTTELVRIPGMSHMGDSTGPLSARKGQNEALLDWFERHL